MTISTRNPTKRRAILYTRVSTTEQADRGYSLRDQKHRLEYYCQIKGIEIVGHYQDDASAKTFERPGFKAMLERLRERKRSVELILVSRWDRFSRNTGLSYGMLRSLADLGVEVNAAEQEIDLTVPENKLLLAFYMAAPEVENDRRSISTKAGMRRAQREGRWVSAPPKGYTMARDDLGKPMLVKNADAAFVKRAFVAVARGRLVEDVYKETRRLGFSCSKNQFHKMLRSPIYCGIIAMSEWRDEPAEMVRGVHEAIVSEDLFERVQLVLEGRRGNRRGRPSRLCPELPLRGYLVCSRCGRNLTGSTSKGRSRYYAYYHCRTPCGARHKAEDVNSAFDRTLETLEIAPQVAVLYNAVLEDVFKSSEADRLAELTRTRRRIGKMQRRLDAADDKLLDDVISADVYERMTARTQQEVETLRRREGELVHVEDSFLNRIRYGLTLATDLGGFYRRATLEVKGRMVGSIFPGKLRFVDGECRTEGVNELFRLLAAKKGDLNQKDEGLTVVGDSQSFQAALPGFEPGTS